MKLTKFESSWGEAAMTAIYPGSRDDGLAGIEHVRFRPRPGEAGDVPSALPIFLAQVMRYLPFRAALGMRIAIWLVALAPFFVLGRLTTITRLSARDRERVVEGLVASRVYVVRSLFLILKTMGALLYGGDASVRARMAAARAPSSGVRPVAEAVDAAARAAPEAASA
jgi:hypothetical protein